MILPRPRRPHTRPVSNAQAPTGDDQGWTERDVEDDLERGIWDEGDDDLDAGSGAHVADAVPESWPRTILAALWSGLSALGASALWAGVSMFGTDPTGPGDGLTRAELDTFGWRVVGIYAAAVTAGVILRRLYAPRVCRRTGLRVR
jgi:hypothetical protein